MCSSQRSIAGVRDMEEKVGLPHVEERRLEALDEVVRELPDESDGVGEEERLSAGGLDAARRRIEGREEAVALEDRASRDPVEERRFARVRVADDGDGEDPLAPLALLGSAMDLLELLLEARYPVAGLAAIDLDLRLARAPRPDTSLLPREVLPEAPEAGERIVELGDLHLDSRLARARPPGEDVEDELGAIDDVDVEDLLDVPRLRGREIVVEYDEVRAAVVNLPGELLDLAFADEGRAVDARAGLQRLPHDRGARAAGEELELGEVLELVFAPDAGQRDADEVGPFGRCFG